MKGKHSKWLSVLLAVTLLLPAGWLAPSAAAEADTKPHIPVLLYHRVVDNATNEWTDTSTEKFKATMKYLHDNGFNTLSAKQYVSIMNGAAEAPDNPVLLTFDDATPDFVTNVVPVLDQYNMNAVQFVATGWIEGDYSLSKEALIDLAQNHPNISLQNHSVHHADNTWSSITKEAAADEIFEADEFIREITGQYPILFAYPYGHHNAAAQAALAESCGIKYAFKVGYPNNGDYALGRHYVMMDTTLQQIAAWLGGPAPEVPEEEPVETVVYHETFANGLGVATSASATLTAVSDIDFAGNDDGHAVHVTGRSAGWNGIDIPFSSVNMEHSKTYTITVQGYIAEDTEVPDGAQALLQNVDTYQGLYLQANLEAGQPFTLTGTHTVDTITQNDSGQTDRALRIQSNDLGAEVSFYIGDIRITTEESTDVEEPEERESAKPFTTITFEDEQFGGVVGRHGNETLTITDEANHTEGGAYSLKVENRSDTWHGPSLRVEQYVDRGHEYKVTAWVKLIEPVTAQLQLSTQVGDGDGASYNNLQGKTVTVEDGWVQLQGTYRYNSVGNEHLTIYVESSNNSTASFYIDDISFEPTGSGVIGVEKDLTPLKDAYEDYFLIGNAISQGELEGTRLELLKMHHNLVSAENAMKPSYAYDDEGNFDFTAEDQLMERALEEGFKVHGHVLVWHQQSREALHTDAEGNPLSREDALANLKTHVQTVVQHFADDVISWDVVNEAMNDNPSNPADWEAALRQSGWLRAVGSDYIEHAYRYAKEVIKENGWDIKLYYNDYNDDNQNKSTAIYHMVKEINENYASENDGELLIDGIGMQAHYNLNTNPENVKLSMERFISLGVEIGVTELDVTAGTDNVLTAEQAKQQAFLYAQLFKLYKENAEHISRVTLWGLNDATSWRAAQSPLLFDKDLKAKPAYYAILDPETYIAEYDGGEEVEANHGQALQGTPIIDGEIDDIWNDAPQLPINRFQMAWQGANGFARVLWDANNLYALFQVSDSDLDDSNPEAHQQDSVEVFVDENNEKTTFYQEDDGQYRVNFNNVTSFNPGSISSGFESVTKPLEGGYLVELKIPFRTITPEVNTQIGFDLQINDGKDGARQSVATWNDLTGQGYQNTSIFGVLTLVDELDDSNDNGAVNGYDNGADDNGAGDSSDGDDSNGSDDNSEVDDNNKGNDDNSGTDDNSNGSDDNNSADDNNSSDDSNNEDGNNSSDDNNNEDGEDNNGNGRVCENDDDDGGNTPVPTPGVPSATTPPAVKEGNSIIPAVTTENNAVIGKVTSEQINSALAQATADHNGRKKIVIQLAKQTNANSYEVQLPAASINGQDQITFSIETEYAVVNLESQAVQDAAKSAEQISIRISPAATDHLSADARGKIGSRPPVSVSLLADNEAIASNSNATMTISIPYTLSEAEKAHSENIVVWHIDENGNTAAIINGRYDEASGAVVFQTNQAGSFAVAYATNGFTDTANVPWAKGAIDAMAARDIIKGTSATSYAPQQSISRADFITLLVRALSLQAENSNEAAFNDVPETAYYYNELAIARALGIASGYSDNSFKPGQEISRQDMMVLTARALAAAGKTLDHNGSLDAFNDADEVAAYAQAQATALVHAGIVKGNNGGIAPHDSTTRAEAAVILYRIWNLQ